MIDWLLDPLDYRFMRLALIEVTIVACHERRPGWLSERTMPRARARGQDGLVVPCSESDDRRF